MEYVRSTILLIVMYFWVLEVRTNDSALNAFLSEHLGVHGDGYSDGEWKRRHSAEYTR
jgi:hypothetical protein